MGIGRVRPIGSTPARRAIPLRSTRLIRYIEVIPPWRDRVHPNSRENEEVIPPWRDRVQQTKHSNMIIKKKDRRKEKSSRDWKVFDYPLRLKAIGIAYQELNGRIPRSGNFRNNICTEIFYIINGSGTIVIKNRKHVLRKGDVVVTKSKEPHYLRGNKLKFLTVTSPNWYPEQCDILSD
jgi:mannose-6-phosphate isomerase-like protein (cupin superfamily)